MIPFSLDLWTYGSGSTKILRDVVTTFLPGRSCMTRISVFLFFLLLFVLHTLSGGHSSFADPSLKPGFPITYGDWSFTTRITMTGIPGIPPRTLTFDDCLTAHHMVVSRLTRNCSMTKPTLLGETLSYTMTCTTGISRAHFTYGKRHLSGEIETRLKSPGGLLVRERITGHYRGPCRKS